MPTLKSTIEDELTDEFVQLINNGIRLQLLRETPEKTLAAMLIGLSTCLDAMFESIENDGFAESALTYVRDEIDLVLGVDQTRH